MMYTIEPRNKFFSVVSSIAEREIRAPGNTVSFFSEVDLTNVETMRAEANAKPSYTAFVVKAVALAIREHPYANRRIVRRLLGKRVQAFDEIDAAVLCEREIPDAPMVAFVDMIRQADTKTLAETTGYLRHLATCTETNNEQWASFVRIIRRLPVFAAKCLVRLPVFFPALWVKYRGGAFVVSSPAKYGVDQVAATWPWPIGVSFGLVRDRPLVKEGEIVVCKSFTLTMNFDRRIMAGAQAARLFKQITDNLETPSVLE